MYLSIEQIKTSVGELIGVHPFFGMTFLALKRENIPVGTSRKLNFKAVHEKYLREFFRIGAYEGFYNPFHSSKTESDHWVKPRYSNTTLQRVAADTFGEAFEHEKGSSSWGWRNTYLSILGQRLDKPIPAFHLAVWLYRKTKFLPGFAAPDLVGRFLGDFSITPSEVDVLFDATANPQPEWLGERAATTNEILEIIGRPPDTDPEEGSALRSLELIEIGPAEAFKYEPAERLNVITGDNSLGKTFLLECAWWALTGEWVRDVVVPREAAQKPTIRFDIASPSGMKVAHSARYDWELRQWKVNGRRDALPGLVIYARFDGSFAVWDPARARAYATANGARGSGTRFFSQPDVWEGLSTKTYDGKPLWLCNGLLRDWVTWQTGGERHAANFRTLTACLETLSPPEGEPLMPGDPVRLGVDAREIPTLQMPYGKVPILHASAGVQRVAALAYLLVWAWNEHQENSRHVRRPAQSRIVMLIDEVEAHLHPRWQRVIVPGLMRTVANLAPELQAQIHLATHSPLVMASTETLFDVGRDKLHHLRLDQQNVALEEIPFVKYGTSDAWLMSDVFGLQNPRSKPAEDAIAEAKRLQSLSALEVDQTLVQNAHRQLLHYLASEDDFWPRWLYFARSHGAV